MEKKKNVDPKNTQEDALFERIERLEKDAIAELKKGNEDKAMDLLNEAYVKEVVNYHG